MYLQGRMYVPMLISGNKGFTAKETIVRLRPGLHSWAGEIPGEKKDTLWGYGIIGRLTYFLFWLQQLPVDTQATHSTASLRATSLTSTTWSSLFATLGMWLRGLLGPSAWPAGSGATRCPPAEVSRPSSPTSPPVPLPSRVL